MHEPNPLHDAILKGDAAAASRLVKEAIDAGRDAGELVNRHMIPAMNEVGRRFEAGEYFVPELLLSGRAMKGALALLRPLLAAGATTSAGTVVIGTVQGDLHDIGKNLVSALLEGAGFQIRDLGVDVPPGRFAEAVNRYSPDILALSALLTITLPSMKSTLEALRSLGVRDRVRVIVGGAPVTREYAAQIGADGYSESAVGAVKLARTLTGQACESI